MPVMVVESDKDVPPSVDYNMATNPGRTYRYFTKSVLYPFGYGLTYTEFEYTDIMISPKSVAACESVVVSVNVKNIGKMDSDEVVQLYVTTPKAPGVGVNSLYNLVGYNRTHITVGSSVYMEFTINAYLMATVDPIGEIVIVPGDFTVHVGNSSPQESDKEVILLKDMFTVTGNMIATSSCPGDVPQCLAC